VTLVRASATRRRLGLLAVLGALALAAVPVFGGSAASAAGCPTFRVLHNDRIGAAVFPAGTYDVTPQPGSNLSCATSSRLFTRFLEDWDGNLPGNWRVIAEGSGRASFRNGSRPGFAVSRAGGGGEEEGGNRLIGRLCPGAYTVNAGGPVGPLYFRRGQYLIYIPTGSGITCNRASRLFTRFLGQPGGTLPYPWRMRNQTATFYKPANPVRSSFRVEAAGGAGPR
jgi:hypothetical protein